MSDRRSILTELLRGKERVSEEWGQKNTLWIHDDNISAQELIVNPELFPGVKEGDCLCLHNPVNGEQVTVRISSIDGAKLFKQRSFQVYPTLQRLN